MGRDQPQVLGSGGKSAAGGDGDPSAARDGSGATELTEDYWLEIWAFGTSPYGLGLTADALWALSAREFGALKRQWESAREYQLALVAALRTDIHNTAGKNFQRTFEIGDFMPGAVDKSVESRVKALIEQGYAPAAAAAMATSKQTNEHRLHLIDSMRDKKKRRA